MDKILLEFIDVTEGLAEDAKKQIEKGQLVWATDLLDMIGGQLEQIKAVLNGTATDLDKEMMTEIVENCRE